MIGEAEPRRRLATAFADRAPRLVSADDAESWAAVVLVLRPGRRVSGPTSGLAATEALFVHRAEVEGDPWSGHMALPGGRADAGDADLIDTALRELAEETALHLSRADVLGRLDDEHPVSRYLPSIVIASFVAWHDGTGRIRRSHEIQDHVWIPLHALTDPTYRSELRLERDGSARDFSTIEYEGYTIWGLTFNIVEGFFRSVPSGV